jgi:hypothetical protein
MNTESEGEAIKDLAATEEMMDSGDQEGEEATSEGEVRMWAEEEADSVEEEEAGSEEGREERDLLGILKQGRNNWTRN